MFEHIPGINERLLGSQRPDYGVLACGWLPLDVDTFAMNNGGTAKEGVGRTYPGTPADPPEAADDPARRTLISAAAGSAPHSSTPLLSAQAPTMLHEKPQLTPAVKVRA